MPLPTPNPFVIVGQDYGTSGQIFPLSPRSRACSPFLASLHSGSSLPDTHPAPFRIALSYLDGDDTDLDCLQREDGVLLLFAQTWALAGKMQLRDLQNKLVDRMHDLYIAACRVRDAPPGWLVCEDREGHAYAADYWLDAALRTLDAPSTHTAIGPGPGSRAQRFLVCFVARLAADIGKLDAQMQEHGFSHTFQKEILEQARSLRCDPIKYELRKFKVGKCEGGKWEAPAVYPTLFASARRMPVFGEGRGGLGRSGTEEDEETQEESDSDSTASMSVRDGSSTTNAWGPWASIFFPSITIKGMPAMAGDIVIRSPSTIARLMSALRLQSPSVGDAAERKAADTSNTNNETPSLRGGAGGAVSRRMATPRVVGSRPVRAVSVISAPYASHRFHDGRQVFINSGTHSRAQKYPRISSLGTDVYGARGGRGAKRSDMAPSHVHASAGLRRVDSGNGLRDGSVNGAYTRSCRTGRAFALSESPGRSPKGMGRVSQSDGNGNGQSNFKQDCRGSVKNGGSGRKARLAWWFGCV